MADSPDTQPYRVLARKYRPSDFTSLIGQEAMVQTLSNAIASGRLAHAFILTGVRGVGKTTTARIIAKALNCSGTDGNGEATAEPCGVCENCVSISEDRHVDVMEMDAASRTGVEDIRELIDGVLYRPVSARYKVYIIDEVHMLSRNAFNALLKTLEEPPEHVKFIFATTEIRRVPVTVLSRCQRFDLRRVKFDVLVDHFALISEKEGANITRGAIGLIAHAADGSVRDGLSLLDQAIAHSGPETEIGEDIVRDMLGVAERVQVFDLFEQLMKGEIAAALEHFDSMYHAGADPGTILQDLAELTHWLTRLKAAPDAAEATPTSDLDLTRGRDVSSRLPMSVLARTWQILLKGLAEVRTAHSAAQAAEMVLIRIAYAAELPTPVEAIASLANEPEKAAAPLPPAPKPTPEPAATAEAAEVSVEAISAPPPPSEPVQVDPVPQTDGPAALAIQPSREPVDTGFEGQPGIPATFEDMVALFSANGEPLLHAYLVNNVHLVKYEIGKISLRVSDEGPKDLAKHLSRCLNDWTGRAWFIEASREEGAATLQQQREDAAAERREAAIAHPLVQKTLEAFPGAKVADVRSVADRDATPETPEGLLPAPDDYLSYDYEDDSFDPDHFDPDDTDEDYI
ncbi:MAG: DNA polymerase III subunit gamma/tau [Rhodospirillaceae bacterium TMED63]|nr:DNA polymerase III subunit gamma/tau [Rhodospirillaceae bacterium]RPG00725.1 MAG: DNA polymerase III subunit gamma/tau [Rhodospirillaceae bacterium TMED63]